jgi:hypothetical protein
MNNKRKRLNYIKELKQDAVRLVIEHGYSSPGNSLVPFRMPDPFVSLFLTGITKCIAIHQPEQISIGCAGFTYTNQTCGYSRQRIAPKR